MKVRLALIILMWFLLSSLQAKLVTGVDEAAQLPFWEWRDEYMSMRLVQRLPDQTRAYFSARGFKAEDVKFIAEHCFFQTVYKNLSGAEKARVIQHDIRDWVYHYKGKSLGIKPREDWKPIWQKRKVNNAQIIAYEWSLLPSVQIFQAGDYNWGMTIFDVPHGASFDLELVWKVDGKRQTATMTNVTCSKDVYIPPQ